MGGTAGYREEAMEEDRVLEARIVTNVLVELRKGGIYSVVDWLRETSDGDLRLALQASGCTRTVSRDSVARIRPLRDRWC